MSRRLPLLLAAALTVLPSLAFAQQYRFTSNDRRNEAEHRLSVFRGHIEDGISSGRLSRREARELRRFQAQIRRQLNVAEADGVITRNEFARIDRSLDEQSRRIARQTGDRETLRRWREG